MNKGAKGTKQVINIFVSRSILLQGYAAKTSPIMFSRKRKASSMSCFCPPHWDVPDSVLEDATAAFQNTCQFVDTLQLFDKTFFADINTDGETGSTTMFDDNSPQQTITVDETGSTTIFDDSSTQLSLIHI